MRIVLADLRGRDGFVSKDTVAGGYGSRLRPFSKTTELVSLVKQRTHDVPSVQLAYLAAIAAECGHDVQWTRTHVYYQYCAYVPDRDALARDCIRRGVDVETLHVDICTRLNLFGPPRACPGADRGAQAVQLPVYESLTDAQISRVAQVVIEALTPVSPTGAPTSAPPIPQSQP